MENKLKILDDALIYLREELKKSPYFKKKPDELEYRYDHSVRCANIGMKIAAEEGMDIRMAGLACILHDLSYSLDFKNEEERKNHGRKSAELVREYLKDKDVTEEETQKILFSIAIHVDNKSDFPGDYDDSAYIVRDADNIDRFDVYRIYENLYLQNFSEVPFIKKMEIVDKNLETLETFGKVDFATKTADRMWKERIKTQKDFFTRLKDQLLSGRHLEIPVPGFFNEP